MTRAFWIWMAKLLAFFLLLVAGLKGIADWISPGFADSVVEVAPSELSGLPATEEGAIAVEGALDLPRTVQSVDYSEGEAGDWYPKGESPMLAEMVRSGGLPPVEERVGAEPLVLDGPDGIGRYGGSLVTAGASPRVIQWVPETWFSNRRLVRWSPMGYPIAPNIVKDWRANKDHTVWTFQLRKGMRWSDGHPFTTEDILYWWDNEVNYFGEPPSFLMVEGENGDIEALDRYTFRVVFPKPNALFIDELMATGELYAPKHYLLPFHPELGDPEVIEAFMRNTRQPSPRALYQYQKRTANPEHPRIWPWILATEQKSPPVTYVRNPYFWAVDVEGNQLPYIDQLVVEVKRPEMIVQAAISGQLDLQVWNLRIEDYPLLMSQRQQGGYRVSHWINASTTHWAIHPNLNRFTDPSRPESVEKARLLSDRRFRIALSVAIDRQEIIELAFHGWGTPSQGAPLPFSPFRHAGLEKAFVQHDPRMANRLLDELGLDQRDGEGYRTFPDGSRMSWFLDYSETHGGAAPLLVTDHWRQVGLRVIPRQRTMSLFSTLRRSREFDLLVWPMPAKPDPILNLVHYLPTSEFTAWAPGYGFWFRSGGYHREGSSLPSGGVRPPPGHPLWKAYHAYDALRRAGDIDRKRELLHEIYDAHAENLWTISIGSAPPIPAIVNCDLRNVPPVALKVQASPASSGVELFYFADSEERLAGGVEVIQIAESDPSDALEEGQPLPAPDGAGSKWRMAIFFLFLGLLVYLGRTYPYVGRRLVYIVPTLLAISIVTFVVVQLPEGSYIDTRIMQAELEGDPESKAMIEEIREIFPIDEPMWKQYLDWMGIKWFVTFKPEDKGLLQGHMGRSMETLEPVNDLIGERLLLTFLISLGTILFTWLTALPIGVYSAVRQYSPGDYIASIIGFIGMSIPNFLLAVLLIFLAYRWFGISISGLLSPEYAAQEGWDWPKVVDLLKHIWVPVVVLGTSGTAGMIRVMRANLLDELKKPYVRTARAKGVRPLKLLVKYPVRLALNPFISGIGSLFPSLVSGGAIVAMVLSLPTIGPLQLAAIMSEDYYLAGSMLMLLSLLAVLGTLVSDLLLLWLDPRIRMEGGQR